MNLFGENFPNGKVFNLLRKKYIVMLHDLLPDIEIERNLHAVVLIDENDSKITQQALAGKLEIDKVRAARIVEYLSNAEYIERSVSAEDRRQYFLKLTALGRKRAIEINKAIRKTNENIFKSLSKEEKTLLKKLILKMTDDLKEIDTKKIQFNCKH